MAGWASDELDRIGAAEELELAAVRNDGSLRPPVTVWVVRHGDDLFVRSVNGRDAAWFKGAQSRAEARIRAGGFEKDVALDESEDAGDQLDEAYRAKYGGRYPGIVPSIVTPAARAATLKLVPGPPDADR